MWLLSFPQIVCTQFSLVWMSLEKYLPIQEGGGLEITVLGAAGDFLLGPE